MRRALHNYFSVARIRTPVQNCRLLQYPISSHEQKPTYSFPLRQLSTSGGSVETSQKDNEDEPVSNTTCQPPRRRVKDIANYGVPGDAVRVQGWVKAYRRLKQNVFIDVSDGSSEHRVPVVADSSKVPKGVNMHTSIDVSGVLKRNPKNPSVLELHATTDVTLVGGCDQKEYPFGGKVRYNSDQLRLHIHLRPKTNKFSSMLRLRSAMSRAVSDYFNDHGFFQVHVPILTSNDCEGAGEIFTVKPGNKDLLEEIRKADKSDPSLPKPTDEEIFFDKQVHLSVSGQLHLECASIGLDKVWTFSPVFRAENQQSTRHLSEFYMIEAELAFAYEIEQILEVMEGLVKFCVRRTLSECMGDWNMLTKDVEHDIRKILDHILSLPFTVMTFEETCTLLREKESSIVPPGKGLSREQELVLVERLNDNRPVFVIDWPKDIKPFYMRECKYDSSKVSAVDLLVPTVGELCGGSLREADLSKLISKINAMDPSGKLQESLAWYTDLRKYGGTPTGGFGLGFDRLLQLVTGIGNIKDVTPFPRWPHHCPM